MAALLPSEVLAKAADLIEPEGRWTCSRCSASFAPIPSDLARNRPRSTLCRECRRLKGLAWRARRREAGNPYKSSKVSEEWKRAWTAEYEARPEIKARRRQNARVWTPSPEQAQKRRARSLTRSAIRWGRLMPLPCEVCGVEPVEAHHDDYSKPGEVRWLCREHHLAHHAALRKAADLARSEGQ